MSFSTTVPPGEPAPAVLITGGAQKSLGISNSVPEDKWETAALSAARKSPSRG